MHTKHVSALADVGELCLQEEAKAKFNESVEIAINLGVDPRRGDQQVRGAVVLPHGTGRDMRVAVFAEDEAAELARSAGERTSLSGAAIHLPCVWEMKILTCYSEKCDERLRTRCGCQALRWWDQRT